MLLVAIHRTGSKARDTDPDAIGSQRLRDNSFVYIDAENNRYWFSGAPNGKLTGVKITSSNPSTNKQFTYTYSGTQLSQVTDPRACDRLQLGGRRLAVQDHRNRVRRPDCWRR